jgi:uncharacterized protein
MGKIAIWILLAVAVMLVLRMIASHKRRADGGSGGTRQGKAERGTSGRSEREGTDPRGTGGELMMSCAVCGVHLPASDAIFARGKVFCGPEHRDLEEAGRHES